MACGGPNEIGWQAHKHNQFLEKIGRVQINYSKAEQTTG